jgi:hypothetical protein
MKVSRATGSERSGVSMTMGVLMPIQTAPGAGNHRSVVATATDTSGVATATLP